MKFNIFGGMPLALAASAILLFPSCSDKKWSAEGTIAGGEGKQLVLEAPNASGGWYAVDTVEVAKDGSFKLSGLPFGHPELLRIQLDGQQAYFPIDSIESVNIQASASELQKSLKLSGSTSAEKMQEVNDLIAAAVAAKGADQAAFDPELKRALAETILRNPSDIVAYYLVFHRVGNNLLFDPAEKSDLRIIGAVANAYTHNRPTDPRTSLLKALYLSNRRLVSPAQPTDTIMATEILYPEISLLDEKGQRRTLSNVAGKGKLVVLCFSDYSMQGSQAVNVELNKVYSAHKGQGLEIFQVGVDYDEFQWRESAKNLPWITVYNTPKDGAENLVNYNVTNLPAIFIINRNGELVERVDAVNRLESTVNRYL